MDAIVLAGGRSSRMGADKASLMMDGRTLLQHAVAACAACDQVVVVGPAHLGAGLAGVQVACEEPPFGGPVAGVAAGLEALGLEGSELVLVVACDLPRVADVVTVLSDAASRFSPLNGEGVPDGGVQLDGVVLVDADGRRQPLAAIYRRASLDAALARLGSPRNASMRRLLANMRLTELPAPDLTDDVDDPAAAGHFGIVVP